MCNKFISDGVSVNAKDPGGNTPLHWAAFRGHEEICRLLLQLGAEVDSPNTTERQTALHWAATSGALACVHRLVQEGAAVDARDSRGYSPLLSAVQHDHSLLVHYLRTVGASIDDTDTEAPL